MRTALLLAFAGALGAAARAEDARLDWTYDGHFRLPDAAADAKRSGRRILVGLSGSPT